MGIVRFVRRTPECRQVTALEVGQSQPCAPVGNHPPNGSAGCSTSEGFLDERRILANRSLPRLPQSPSQSVVDKFMPTSGKGKGTLAPWELTQSLVVEGVYRHVRTPMISGVILVLLGESMLTASLPVFFGSSWLSSSMPPASRSQKSLGTSSTLEKRI